MDREKTIVVFFVNDKSDFLMNKKIFSVLLAVVSTASYVQAQFSIGVRAGLNLTNVSAKNASVVFGWEEHELLNPKYKHGFQIGVIGEYGISNNFAIQY